MHISDLLGSLARYERRFQLALCLFELSLAENSVLANQVENGQLSFNALDLITNTLSGWQLMAAREGALAIYHFGQALFGVASSLGACPTLSRLVDHPAIRLSRKSFEATFPGYDAIRHAVAHVADFSATTEKRKIHSIRGPWKYQFGRISIEIKDEENLHRFTDNLYDRSYCVTFEGQVHKYDITAQTLEALSRARERIFSAFAAAI